MRCTSRRNCEYAAVGSLTTAALRNLCPSVSICGGFKKTLGLSGFARRWTATVSKSVSHGADGKTIRQNWLELAETSPHARSQSPLKQDWYLETEKASYENKIHHFRRGEMFYMQDSATGKQTSLRTKDETEAKSLLEARNAAQRQPVLNLHLARAYLTASDPPLWNALGRPSWNRCRAEARTPATSVTPACSNRQSFDALRQKKLLETTADDFFAVFKTNKVSIVDFLKRLHNFAFSLAGLRFRLSRPTLAEI